MSKKKKEFDFNSIFEDSQDNQKEELDMEFLKSLSDEEKERGITMKMISAFSGCLLEYDTCDKIQIQAYVVLNFVLHFCNFFALVHGFNSKKMLKYIIDNLQKDYDEGPEYQWSKE